MSLNYVENLRHEHSRNLFACLVTAAHAAVRSSFCVQCSTVLEHLHGELFQFQLFAVSFWTCSGCWYMHSALAALQLIVWLWRLTLCLHLSTCNIELLLFIGVMLLCGNTVPQNVTSAPSLTFFCRERPKSHLFSRSFPHSSVPAHWLSFRTLYLFIYVRIYLLLSSALS